MKTIEEINARIKQLNISIDLGIDIIKTGDSTSDTSLIYKCITGIQLAKREIKALKWIINK